MLNKRATTENTLRTTVRYSINSIEVDAVVCADVGLRKSRISSNFLFFFLMALSIITSNTSNIYILVTENDILQSASGLSSVQSSKQAVKFTPSVKSRVKRTSMYSSY